MIPTEPAINPGARPTNETSETDAAAHVQSIFDSIAPSYDLLNHLISMGLDRRWWSRSARAVKPILERPESRVLDLCCGTGDMTAALLKLRPKPSTNTDPAIPPSTNTNPGAPPSPMASSSARVGPHDLRPATVVPVTGLDFSSQMLDRARIKYPAPAHNAIWVEGDAMHLPYPDNSFDLVTAAFGFRNLTNYAEGLAEIYRVLAPNGRLAILECNQPDGLSGFLYTLYFQHIMPIIGGFISGDRAAYNYLPASVARFPRPPQMLRMIQEAGFINGSWQGYLLRAAGLYLATKL